MKYLTCIFSFLFLGLSLTSGQTNGSKKERKLTFFDVINQTSEVQLIICGQIDSVLENRFTPNTYPSLVKVMSGEKLILEIPAKLSARGRFRRKKCDFPPLKLDLPKGKLKDMGLDNADDYKVVTHCLDSRIGERILQKEFLIYQMFEMLTGYCYRTVMLPVKYVDIESKDTTEKSIILIESHEELADRFDGDWCNCMGTEPEEVDIRQYELIALFQYMIGNRDMDLKTEHNLRLLMRDGYKYLPIPYDFDFSIFVKAPYAYVTTHNFQPRLYLGYAQNAHLVESLLPRFVELKKSFFDLIKEQKSLPKSDRRWCRNYLKSFYNEIKRKNFLPPYNR